MIRVLAAKRSAGVAAEVNLRNSLHEGNEEPRQGIHPGHASPKVQYRGSTKRTNVLQIFF